MHLLMAWWKLCFHIHSKKHEKCLAYGCRKSSSTAHALYHGSPTETCCQMQTMHTACTTRFDIAKILKLNECVTLLI